MGADNQAEKVLDRIARLEAAEAEIERLNSKLEFNERGCALLQAQKEAADAEIERLRAREKTLENTARINLSEVKRLRVALDRAKRLRSALLLAVQWMPVSPIDDDAKREVAQVHQALGWRPNDPKAAP